MNASPSGAPLLRDVRILLYLFVGFRLMILLVYQPLEGFTPGVTAFGDYQHYYNLAKLSDDGKLPYRDYWYEFPPVFPIISLALYKLAGAGGFSTYAVLFGVVMTAFDTANLLLLRRIGSRLYNVPTGSAMAWMYALLAAPLIFSFWTFEPVVAFSILLAMWWLLVPDNGGKPRAVPSRDIRSALAVAFGALTKLFPLALLAAVWRFHTPRRALRYTVIAVGLTLAGLLIMLAIAGPFGIPSLMAQFNKASYQSVWALLDRNYKTGNFGPMIEHFDPAQAYAPLGNPAVIPWWLRGIIFGAIGLFVYARTRRYDNRGLVAFIAITITLFFLWSQGWSPQWLMVLIPLILLNYPTRQGVLFCLLLTLGSFIEYPLFFSHNADPNGAIVAAQIPPFALLVIARTALLIVFAVALYRRLRTSPLILQEGTQTV